MSETLLAHCVGLLASAPLVPHIKGEADQATGHATLCLCIQRQQLTIMMPYVQGHLCRHFMHPHGASLLSNFPFALRCVRLARHASNFKVALLTYFSF